MLFAEAHTTSTKTIPGLARYFLDTLGATQRNNHSMKKAFKFLFQAVGVFAAVSLFLLGIAVIIYGFAEGLKVIAKTLALSTAESSVIYGVMGVLDLILLSFSIFITSIGIYELFVQPLPDLPDWIQVKDLDALKSMLIKVIIVVMGISFMGKVVTWDGEQDIMGFGFSVAAVILALSYFLKVKIKAD